jgi:hypothetical protein
MRRHNEKQRQFENFEFMVGGKRRSDNRWVNLAKQIPWKDIEGLYASSLSGTGQGAPARSVRIAPGALIIKERLRMSDEETVEQLKENPYQDFPGLKQYEDKAVFHPTLFVHFRKRFLKDIIIRINNLIAENALSEKKNRKNSDEGDAAPGAGTKNKGRRLVDATCAPEEINTPTDLKRQFYVLPGNESGRRVEGRLFVSFTPASRSLWPLFSGLSFHAYKKNCDNLDVCPCYIWAFLTRQAFSGSPI